MFRGSVSIALLSSNRHITYAWHLHEQAEHKRRLQNMKHALDNKPPRQYPHLSTRYKKEMGLEERYSRIEQENRLLLKVRTPPSSSASSAAASLLPRALSRR